MASERLRRMLQEARERETAAALPDRLPGIRCGGYRQETDLPAWVATAIAGFIRTDSVPVATIGEDAGPERLADWIESFARDRGLGDHVLIGTGMRFFPWLECVLPGSGWATAVRAALGEDLFAVSADGTVLVAVLAEEYDYLGFAAHASAPGG
ncbi:hypothetical protein [Streptomyces sp. RFCAC02]|uniref:hypothetical protein n=1 Tax=Streptomyces sp. RFCAC02 TaxID=2499143 RepID=UPI00101EFEBA|nr:hypothetical protein [Streptomyces sp. RFCAC02]